MKRPLIALCIGSFLALGGAEAWARANEGDVEFLPSARLYRSAATKNGTNHAGFHERELALTAAEGVGRIAVLGDSMTWGQGTAEQTWPRAMETRLGPACEVLNFATYGSDTRQQWATLPEIWPYRPASVLLGVYWNDAIPNRMLQLGRFRTPVWLEKRAWPWAASAAYRALHGLWNSRGYSAWPERGYVERWAKTIRDEAGEHQASLTAVLLWPHALYAGVSACIKLTNDAPSCRLADETTRSLKLELEGLDIPVIDTLPAVDSLEPTLNTADWEHPPPAVDERIGAWMAERVSCGVGLPPRADAGAQ